MKIKANLLVVIILFCIPIILYLLFRRQIVEEWNNIESMLFLLSYLSTTYLYLYTKNIKFYFFVHRLLMILKYDHTSWLVSINIISNKDIGSVMDSLEGYFINNRAVIKKKTSYQLEVLYNNSFLIKFSASQNEDNIIVFCNTSKIIVPIKQLNKISKEISCMIDELQILIPPVGFKEKTFEIDIEYSNKSPYYSYWLKKMPEELISNFNCTIKLPDKKEDLVRVNKNHIIIKSNNNINLFNLAKDYISLQATL